MANEIKVTASISVTNGTLIFPAVGAAQQSITQSTLGGGGPGYLSIGTSEEAITFTDVGTLGWCWIKNLDATNFVKWGPESAGAMVAVGKLKAGESCVFRLMTGVTLRMQADTAACKVQIHCFEN
jgi:hypothetical protein